MICAPESKVLKIFSLLLHPSFAIFITAEDDERGNLVMGNEYPAMEADEKCGFGCY